MLLMHNMSGIKCTYEAWAERTISEAKGRRVIHFYLVSTSERPLLAVVATEKNDRHFSYEVSDNYIKVFGSSPSINAQTKWTSRSIMLEWLSSLVRKDNLPPPNLIPHNAETHEGDAQMPEPMPREPASFKVGDHIEFLSKDEKMHDFWYKCKILEMYKKFWKVQCNDRKCEEVSGNFEQEHCIPPPRLAPPGELSLRHTGRLTIRPCPPEEEAPTTFEVGAAVDAWWKNGWWEGFVITVESLSSSDSYHVFLPGPRKFLTLHLKDLRASRDWVDDAWVLIRSHPDILSFVC
ncbi:uncharacterized protein LOC141661308 isoform X1 [Apium graveolens]|uniref:uncharacterized protein LOC141661308 isoform X1 n=2 Tax=Apium graveolens TaxID=4045 RepID=UPI003D796F31